ncbi:FISUMP domain-containing protein [Fibrobacter sp. UBA2449]|uniref:FISUMP domain-containing protein n=1 Tax=Fibrobacter sp. UBA2449 TaxID=1946529 RepID=UPI0025C161CB|nr:FISUMP domain-containing protein [Fibrobacter sp. UBA2449]
MSIIRKAPLSRLVGAVAAFAMAFALAACDDDESSFVRPGDDSSSSVCEDCDDASSSSVKSNSSSSAKSSSSVKAKSSSSSVAPKSSSSAKSSSSSAKSSSSISSSSIASSSSAKSSSSSAKSSSSSLESSSSEAYQHWFPLNGDLKDKYATFVDSRNGREYYYILMEANGKSLKVMAENLNVGEMVWGFKDQKDDSKIERYCYDDDTTKCDRYGALYQWAEMMQLPSECNTKSCADQIKPNHQGICPDGWRLMTADDFKFIINSNGNKDGVKGTRSTFGFGGSNDTGFSLVGAGARNDEGGFEELNETAYWFYLDEYSDVEVLSSVTSAYMDKNPTLRSNKKYGFSVRCVMVE